MARKSCYALIATLLLAALPAALAQSAPRRLGSPIVVKNPQNLIGGPFIVAVGPKTATVTWITKSRGQELAPTPDQRKLKRVTRCEKVTFKGLQPGTTYYYEFRAIDRVTGRFKTPPAGPEPFRFGVYGDTRSRHDVHQKVADAVAKTSPDFVLHTGDLVADGTNTMLWPIFFSIEKELLRNTVLFPVLGNHERNSPQYYMFLQVKPYYSFDWGRSHFAMLNSSIDHVSGNKEKYWEEQKRWLETDLAGSQKADFRFVAFHHPPFSAVKKRGPNERTQQLVPLFEKYNVAAVFSGHDHNYAHFLKDGVRYIVTGGGGAPLYPVDGPVPGITQKVASTEHFMLVNVAGNRAVLEAIGIDGARIDRIELAAAAETASRRAAGN